MFTVWGLWKVYIRWNGIDRRLCHFHLGELDIEGAVVNIYSVWKVNFYTNLMSAWKKIETFGKGPKWNSKFLFYFCFVCTFHSKNIFLPFPSIILSIISEFYFWKCSKESIEYDCFVSSFKPPTIYSSNSISAWKLICHVTFYIWTKAAFLKCFTKGF